MKKVFALLLTLTMTMALLAGCGSDSTSDTTDDAGDTTGDPQETTLSGTVATDGSTSMESVIGVLGEQFMADNSGVTVTYNPTGSGAGIEAVANGSCDIGLASRALKDEEKSGGLTETIVALDGIAVIVNAENAVCRVWFSAVSLKFPTKFDIISERDMLPFDPQDDLCSNILRRRDACENCLWELRSAKGLPFITICLWRRWKTEWRPTVFWWST